MPGFGRSLLSFCCLAADFGVPTRPCEVEGGDCKLGIAEWKLQSEYSEAETSGDHLSPFFNLQFLLRNLQWQTTSRGLDELVPALMLAGAQEMWVNLRLHAPGFHDLSATPRRAQTRRRPGASCPGVPRLAGYPRRAQTRRRPGASCPGVPRLASYLHAPNLRRPSPPRSLSSGAFRGRNAPRWASSRHGLEFRARGGPCTRCPEIKRGPWRPRNVPAEATYQGSASKSVAGSDGSRQVLEPRGMKPRGVALFPQSSRDAGNAISWLANLVVLGQPRAQTPDAPGLHAPGLHDLSATCTRPTSGGRALPGRFPVARSEAATLPAGPRAATAWSSAPGAARARAAPKSSGDRGGLGTCRRKQRIRARPQSVLLAQMVADKSWNPGA
jgi:hypothetical protein